MTLNLPCKPKTNYVKVFSGNQDYSVMQTLIGLFILFFLALSKCDDMICCFSFFFYHVLSESCVGGLLTSCCKLDETTFSAARSVCAVSAACL